MEKLALAGAVKDGGIAMLIIDTQVDFHPGGTLAVSGANEDSHNIATFIETHLDDIHQINITLDSHQRYHIAHAIFWQNVTGESPAPFTLITAEDIRTQKWTPTDTRLIDYAIHYTESLERHGRFTLCIWPEHCIVGSPGHAIQGEVHDALMKWTAHHKQAVNYVLKGTNCFTEHYSALRADVEVPSDPTTRVNSDLIQRLQRASKVCICGEALSHCVNFTTRDLVEHWKLDEMAKLHVLTDCSSPVPGFEAAGETFLRDMKSAGLTLALSSENS